MALVPATSVGGSSSGVTTLLSKPVANITRAATTVGAFSTAWQITSVVVASGQNVRLRMTANSSGSVIANDCLFAIFRGVTQIAAFIYAGSASLPRSIEWIDENPGAATYTYEIQAAQFVAGTLTVYQTNITTDVNGGSSIFMADVYTP